MAKDVDLDQVEREASRRWDTDASVRKEFPTKATYIAFQKADASGSVKILGRPSGIAANKAGG